MSYFLKFLIPEMIVVGLVVVMSISIPFMREAFNSIDDHISLLSSCITTRVSSMSNVGFNYCKMYHLYGP